MGILAGHGRILKASRDKIRGVLRYSAAKPNWEVKIFYGPDGCEKMDGLVLLSDFGNASRIARSVVRIDTLRESGGISIDNAAIGRLGAEFFLRRGYRTLAFVGSNLAATNLNRHSRVRCEHYVATAREANVEPFVHQIDENASADWIGELERLSDFIRELPKPCGLLACADETAKLVLDACRLAHVRVPDQLALLGVDNETDICENLQPSLSSILPDFERCGYIAARLLDQAMRDRRRHPRGSYVYGVDKLVERESTTDLRGGGRLVSAATEIIRRQALSGLRVADLATALNVSTRLLEQRFREIKGRSARDEIISVRMEEVLRLVRQTKLTFSQIAVRCGWKSPTALQILFRRRFGKSMRACRGT